MKNKLSIIIPLMACLLAIAAQPTPKGTPTSDRVRAIFHDQLNDFDGAIAQFIHSLETKGSDVFQWQGAYARMRDAYKRIEFLVAYLDEESTKDYLNGAPLPSLNRVVAQVEVMPPAGMQIIEENLFGEAPEEQHSFVLDRAREMRARFWPVAAALHQLPITDRQILEAVRAGLFRITTLGITGFDTPGSGRALQEAAIGLEAMRSAVALYSDYLPSGRGALADSVDSAFDGAIGFLIANDNFDTFDRMTFIRNWMEPLYGLVLDLHLALGIETIYEVTTLAKPLNYLSGSMFATATLNDHYYAGIGAAKEKPAVVALGRLLFFDPILSADNTMACSSCHQPARAFTDGLPKSKAAGNGTLSRNAPTIINSVYADKFFYDLRSDRLENQAEHVIFSVQEFNTTYYEMMEKLNQSKTYRQLFMEAFQKPINAQDVSRALAAYVRSLASFNSPVDQYLRGEIHEIPSEEIKTGFNLFMGKAACATCHFPPTYTGLVPPSFSENESEVIGVPADPQATPLQLDPDLGRYNNGRPRDRADHLQFGFKTTTVRNVALTGPYMHNGVYATLEEVVDFYNRGGGAGMGLDIPHQTLPFDNLNLSKTEQRSLVKFMEALTDTTGLTAAPQSLPRFEHKPEWNHRAIGGDY